tara:strand:+ start:5545 stop:6003 length:459 start_codon:yes stop_codon:yes gene_type:complete
MGKLADFETNLSKKNIKKNNVIKSISVQNNAVKAKTKARSYMDEPEIVSPSSIQVELEKKLKALEAENKKLRSKRLSLTKNEEKVLSAIRSEEVFQENEWPLISTNILRKKYKVHPAYFSKSIDSLLSNGFIDRKEATYSGKIKTYRYKILK